MVHRLAKMAGYKIEERIVLMDMQTGRNISDKDENIDTPKQRALPSII